MKTATEYFNHQHIPTGRFCHVMAINGDRAFCDFGEMVNPFTNVLLSELALVDEAVEQQHYERHHYCDFAR